MYRCAPYVRGCLESVLAQTFPVDEIVLVDDRGGDESVPLAQRVLAEHGRPHTLIRQPRNGGLGRA
ncbi:putative glycosyltransferase, partial [Gordonia polyisoprenivorans NBRC 16320 = JCM 10675]